MSDFQVGSVWYVRIGNTLEVTTHEILEITDKTVLMKDVTNKMVQPTTRYITNEIEFIECVK